VAGNHFSRNEPGIFTPILDALLNYGDHYRHLADLASYAQTHQRLGELYADQPAWTRKVILNLAASGRFSSNRTIAEYAREIWHAEPFVTGLPEVGRAKLKELAAAKAELLK
jgi:starch phosphorylase